MSSMYMLKRRGPSGSPCLTPTFSMKFWLSFLIVAVTLLCIFAIRVSISGSSLSVALSLLISRVRSIESNAPLKSTKVQYIPWLRYLLMMLCMTMLLSLVPYRGVKPICSGAVWMSCCSLVSMICERSLPKTLVRCIGR